MRLPFQAGAAEEFEEAAAWYERERRGYGALLQPKSYARSSVPANCPTVALVCRNA